MSRLHQSATSEGPPRPGPSAKSSASAKQAKLAFAAAEDARQRGDALEHTRLLARWRELRKGIACAG